ncbi:MAG: pyridoxal phosphate-dependent decarboxylase family protein [Acidimicrobiales bacterium]
MSDAMHRYSPGVDDFDDRAMAFARRRIRLDAEAGGVPLGHPRPPEDLDDEIGTTITPDGLGESEALRIFTDVLEPSCLSTDFHRYFAFIPAAPTEVSIIADMVVSACSIYGGTWLEGSGAVWAENQALRWIADLAGLPPEAGGCFVSGGTIGNLSALVAARHAARGRTGEGRPQRSGHAGRVVVAGESAHASMEMASEAMDIELVTVPGTKLTGAALAPVLDRVGSRAFAVVATAGSTNLGLVDDIASVADVCREGGVWLHVDGAYGGAAMAAPSARWRFAGIERADSVIVDPHKWLFAPFDACALLYREPERARACHTQHSSYLSLESTIIGAVGWDPSDYALHLTRRTRGLPLWLSLAAHGTRAYAAALEMCLETTRAAADLVRQSDHLDLVVEPELSVVAFRRRGWTAPDYFALTRRLLDAGVAFIAPSAYQGEPMLRICIVNPRTAVDDVRVVLDAMA